jgi:NadR type nicotinamide-nucleotide adenylyltransferase
MTGLLLGKFMPVHAGHQLLIDTAIATVGERALTVVVGTQPDEPIPGALRWAWVHELYPRVTVVHLNRTMPQEPADHPNFWPLWVAALLDLVPTRPDLVFTSEPYGDELAHRLGARHVSVDPTRSRVPVSGRAIRQQPRAHWSFLPPPVRAYYARRVVLHGA